MNELKEQIDNQDFTLKLYNICSDLFRNDQIPDVGVEVIKDLIVDDLMQLIETYTSKQCQEAYKRGYRDGGISILNKDPLKNVIPCSSQLTNNKKEV